MRHFMIDERLRDDGRADESMVFYQRHFWSWTGPVWPVCWLLGHKPAARWNNGGSYVECARCPARPYDREGLRIFAVRMDQLRPGREVWADARHMEPPTAQELAFAVQEIPGRGPWSQPEHEFKLEMPIRRKLAPEFSIRVHAGGRGSETPWDGHLTIGGSGVYVGVGIGGHLAHRITGGEGRDAGLSLHDGHLRWSLWDTPGEWHRGQPWWWTGSFTVRPSEWLWGRRRYTTEHIDGPRLVVLRTAEGTVHDDVELALAKQWHGWERRPRPRGRFTWIATWKSEAGIPFRNDSWKGDSMYSSAVELTSEEVHSGRWSFYALQRLRAQITADRLRYGWRNDR